MSRNRRLSILTSSEVDDLYSVPTFNESYQRFYFALNDKELAELSRIRERKYRCVGIALLGYFKCKPVQLNPTYKSMQEDLAFIARYHFKDLKFRRFSLKADKKSRIYERVLSIVGVSNWKDKEHQPQLVTHLLVCAESWASPRALFDAAIEYLAHQEVAVPSYSTLQKIVSRTLNQHQQLLYKQINVACSEGLTNILLTLVSGEEHFTLKQLRQSARNFTGTELQKELTVYHHVQPLMEDVTTVLDSLSLSQKNQLHYAERVDYYGAKLKRQPPANQRLYLLCYLQSRYQQCLERIAEGFIHHIRQVKQRAHQVAQERVFQDWQKAARNVSKAAAVLHLFVDDRIDPNTSFLAVQQQAFQFLNASDLNSVTLVRKLSGYKHNHPLLKALTEYNRLLKAQYLLNYIDDASLRNHVQRALNRGEAYHQLRRAISNVNGDRFRGNSDEEIQIWNESARLVANAIIYFNSKVLSNLLDSFEDQGNERYQQTVKQASPVAWENINFRGTYTFAPTGEMPKLEALMAPIQGYRPKNEK